MVLVQGDGLDGTAPHHNLHLFILFELFLCHLPTPVVDSHHALLLLNLPDVIALDDDSRDSHLPGKPLLCWISFCRVNEWISAPLIYDLSDIESLL